MCGRMSHAGITWAELAGWMDGLRPAADPDLRYNVPPTAMIPIILRDGDALAGDFARWGLVPHWHRKPLADWKANTINARVERLNQTGFLGEVGVDHSAAMLYQRP